MLRASGMWQAAKIAGSLDAQVACLLKVRTDDGCTHTAQLTLSRYGESGIERMQADTHQPLVCRLRMIF